MSFFPNFIMNIHRKLDKTFWTFCTTKIPKDVLSYAKLNIMCYTEEGAESDMSTSARKTCTLKNSFNLGLK